MSDLPKAPEGITIDFNLTFSDVQEWALVTDYLTPTGFALDFGLNPNDVPELLKTDDVVRYAYTHILARAEKLTLQNMGGRMAMINKIETALDMSNTSFGTGLYEQPDDPNALFKKAE